MHVRIFMLTAMCGAMVWGGYQASVRKAGATGPSIHAASDLTVDSEVPAATLASAGDGTAELLAGTEGATTGDGYRISALAVFSNVALHVKDNYVDPARIDPKEMLRGALREIERQIAEVLVEELPDGKVKVSVPGQSTTVTVADVESLWEINLKLREVFRFFEKHLPPQKDARSVEYAAINGALSTLDPHSVLLKPEAFAEMKTSTRGEFGGLGIVISIRDGKLTIMSPLDGTPASRAGLKAMDVITRIGDVSTVSMPIEEAVRMLRGSEGSKVTIWVERKGWPEARKHTLTRERIKIESVESELLEKKIGYVKIKNFQQNTGRDLEDHVKKLEKKAQGSLQGLILDLRNNPGGLLEQAIKVSDKFLSSGDIVTTVGYGNKLREPKRAQWSTSDLELPVAVLVNNGSASASEIVAGALKNLDRAVVIGERTFGKGSVQVLYDNFADSSALKLTIAQYLTPGNVSIQSVGVAPDIALEPTWIDKSAVRYYHRPDLHREQSLNKHLDRAKKAEEPEVSSEVELNFLVERIEAEEGAEEDEESAPPVNFKTDFPIEFTRDFLALAGAGKRADMMKKAKGYLETRRQEQLVKIQGAIEKLGLDWTPGPADAAASLVAELELTAGHEGLSFAAGSEVSLEARVTNRSDGPLHRLHGHLETDHPAFKDRELLFGTIAPGETKKWTVTTKIPREAASRSDVIKLVLASDETSLGERASLAVTTKYVAHPQFAYSYSFDDEARGDGDGMLEPGEGCDFVVFVSNVGPGDADDVSLRIKNGADKDLFLERGRVQIGALKAGETKVGRLQFKIRKNQSAGRTTLPIELTIYDPATGEWLEDEIGLVAQPVRPDKLAKKSGSAIAPEGAVVRAYADAGAPVLATLEKGDRVSFDAKLGSWFRAQIRSDAYGWIHADQLKPRNIKGAPFETLAYHPGRRPPVIELEGVLGGRVVETDRVAVAGEITGRALRDMYVVLNDKKTFYAQGPQLETPPSGAWTKPDDLAVRLPFKTELPLEAGLNKILIVARLDERVITYRNLFVSRVESAPKVAEAIDANKKDRAATP